MLFIQLEFSIRTICAFCILFLHLKPKWSTLLVFCLVISYASHDQYMFFFFVVHEHVNKKRSPCSHVFSMSRWEGYKLQGAVGLLVCRWWVYKLITVPSGSWTRNVKSIAMDLPLGQVNGSCCWLLFLAFSSSPTVYIY